MTRKRVPNPPDEQLAGRRRGRQRSTLPEFRDGAAVYVRTDRVGFPAELKARLFTCPREGCFGWFVVEDLRHSTTPCPHCFKVSRVPA